MRDNRMLKCIILDLWGASYYSFNHVPSKRGKRWVNYNREVLKKENREDKKQYHVNLAWLERKNRPIDLDLADCLTCSSS